jgi:hypothetical protein
MAFIQGRNHLTHVLCIMDTRLINPTFHESVASLSRRIFTSTYRLPKGSFPVGLLARWFPAKFVGEPI